LKSTRTEECDGMRGKVEIWFKFCESMRKRNGREFIYLK